MSDPFRILLLEASLDDAQLVLLSLEQQGMQIDCQRVQRVIQESNVSHNEVPIRILMG